MGVISKGCIRGGGKKRPGRACQHCDPFAHSSESMNFDNEIELLPGN